MPSIKRRTGAAVTFGFLGVIFAVAGGSEELQAPPVPEDMSNDEFSGKSVIVVEGNYCWDVSEIKVKENKKRVEFILPAGCEVQPK